MAVVLTLRDGRWFDAERGIWRTQRGLDAPWPDLVEVTSGRRVKVVIAAAHRDHNVSRSAMSNLVALCQRCHLRHDRPAHRLQRWLTRRSEWAIADLFLGRYVRGPWRMRLKVSGRPPRLGQRHGHSAPPMFIFPASDGVEKRDKGAPRPRPPANVLTEGAPAPLALLPLFCAPVRARYRVPEHVADLFA